MRFGPAYYDARRLQVVLIEKVRDRSASVRDVALCVGAWINLEKLKREIRGIPPLAAAKLKELCDHMERVKSLRRAEEPAAIEIEPAPAQPTPLPSISITRSGVARLKTLKERMSEASAAGEIE